MKNLRIVADKKQLLCIFTLLYVLFIGFFTWNFKITEMVYYLTDVLIILLVVMCLGKIPRIVGNKEIGTFTISIGVLFVVGTLSALVQSFNLGLWAWSIRNWGRMIAFLYLCIACLDLNAINRVICFFVRLYDINTVVILIQYCFLRSKYGADQLNGLFGRMTSGINVTVSLIVFCIVISGYFAKRINRRRLFMTIIEISAVAVVAELRAVFVFLVLLVFAYIVANLKFSVKQFFKYFALASLVIISLVAASYYLVKIYPYFEGFFNIRRIIADASTEGGYGYTGYIDRLNAIPVINKYFFNELGLWVKLFGIGMGNGEYSSVNFLTSPFYNKFGNTFHYMNFTSAVLYLEVGFVGLILYSFSFIGLLVKFTKDVRSNKEKSKQLLFYQNIGLGAALISIIFILYNNLQRADGGIILAFFLAVPIIARKGIKYDEFN